MHFHHTFSVPDSHVSSSRTLLWELKLFRSWTVTLSELCLPPGSSTSSSALCTGPALVSNTTHLIVYLPECRLKHWLDLTLVSSTCARVSQMCKRLFQR